WLPRQLRLYLHAPVPSLIERRVGDIEAGRQPLSIVDRVGLELHLGALVVEVEETQMDLRAGVVHRRAATQQPDRHPVAPDDRLGGGELRGDLATLGICARL